MSERYDAGMKVRRQVLGDAHVDRATTEKTEFDLEEQRSPHYLAVRTLENLRTLSISERNYTTP